MIPEPSTSGSPDRPDPTHNPAPAAGDRRGQSSRFGRAWRAFGFFVRAVEIRLRFVAVLVGIGLLIGYWDTLKNYWEKWTRPPATVAALDADTEFYCPMHPQVVRDKLEPDGSVPKCPICGMPLSKRRKGEAAPLPEGIVSRVQFTPLQIQAAGIRTVPVTVRPLVYRVRTVGYIAYDETQLSKVVSRVSGYLETLYVNETFQEVAANQRLAEIYSPELYAALEELRTAQRSGNRVLYEAARQKLRLLGVADSEIDQALSAGQGYRMVLRAPRSGVVVAKPVLQGASVMAGQTLLEVADLSRVWIEADIFEQDMAFVRVGQKVTVHVDAWPNETFPGEVALIYPQLNEQTRTIRVRFTLPNPETRLRPGMYATVELEVPIHESELFRRLWAHPSGQHGNDEATLVARQRICPITGARLGSMGKPVREEVDDRVVYLCCAGCRSKFEADPQTALARLQTVTSEGVLAVPEEAVIDTGREKLVYVEREAGLFEGVVVKLGPRAEGYYAVLEGLLAGDRVAAAGAFLIDAETRLNPAAAAAYYGASGHTH